jgi:thiol-disulfide isomerase/thioredoxin
MSPIYSRLFLATSFGLALTLSPPAAQEAPPAPRVELEQLAALLPGQPLGPWADAGRHPIALLVWPGGNPSPEAVEVVEWIAGTYRQVGVGALLLSVGAEAGAVPSVRIGPGDRQALAALAGPDALEAFDALEPGLPLVLLRAQEGSFTSRGELDIEVRGYNLIRGLKEQLNVRFASLEPLRATAVTDLEGVPVDLEAFLEGLPTDVVLLDIWGTWCPPCQQSLPHLVRLSEAYRDEVTFVGLTCESGDTLEERRASLEAYQAARDLRLPYPLLFGDLWGLRLDVPDFLGYPTLLLLERSPAGWRIGWQHIGFVSGDETTVEEAIRAALAAAR